MVAIACLSVSLPFFNGVKLVLRNACVNLFKYEVMFMLHEMIEIVPPAKPWIVCLHSTDNSAVEFNIFIQNKSLMNKIAGLIAIFLFCTIIAHSQAGYSNYQQQNQRAESLVKQYPQLAKSTVLARTAGGKDIRMLTIGTGDVNNKPAIAIIGGVEGKHLLGTELALGFAEKLLAGSKSDSVRNLLEKTTFYVFPNMSPDAMEQYFAPLKYERSGNAVATDDDRDGRTNEDGFDDLDGNGKITQIRIASPIGEYLSHPDDPAVLIKADITKGERGKFIVYTEGIDNDKDGEFNEDGEGGVWFNKNLSFKHPSFTPGSGEYAVSEIETRALLDKLFTLFNVYAVISFSAQNNLSTPMTFNAATTTPRVITGYLEPDVKVNEMVSQLYNKTTNMKEAPKSLSPGGDLLSWAYFHYGRFSFSTPGWFVPKAKTDTAKKEKPVSPEDATVNFLRWSKQENIPLAMTPWKKINHPDFPGQEVEVGGVDPFVMINPPFLMVEPIVKKHTDFIIKLAEAQPEIDIADVKVEKLSGGISRVTVSIMNKGLLPSHSKLGERSYWIKRINVNLGVGATQSLVSGKKVQVLNALDGLSSRQISWLVKGSGKVTVEAGSPTTGRKKMDINL